MPGGERVTKVWQQRKEDEECNESDYVTEGGITRASFRETVGLLSDTQNPFFQVQTDAGNNAIGCVWRRQRLRRRSRYNSPVMERELGLFIHFVVSPTNAKCLSRHRTSPVAWQQSEEKGKNL